MPGKYGLFSAVRASGVSFRKGSEDQPRDENGRWTSGGSAGTAEPKPEPNPHGSALPGRMSPDARQNPTPENEWGVDEPEGTTTTYSGVSPESNFREAKPPSDTGAKQDLEKWSKDLTEKTQKQWDSLSDDEKRAVLAYAGESYKEVNKSIGEAKGNLSGVPENIRQQIEILDKAVSKGTLPENTMLLKGLDPSRLEGFPEARTKEALEALVGKVLTDHSFGSTTTSPKEAEMFAANHYFKGMVMRIEAPEGTKGLWLGDTSRTSQQEHEFLLPRGSRYMVTGVVTTRQVSFGAAQFGSEEFGMSRRLRSKSVHVKHQLQVRVVQD